MAIELVAEDVKPPRTRLDDDAFMAVWPRMDPEIKRELLRAEREIQEGIAIIKDRQMRRKKKDVAGFWGLELADAEVYRLEGIPRKAPDLAKARERAAELRTALADDEREIKKRMKDEEELEPVRRHAESMGLTLPQYIQKCCDIEIALSRDLLGGLFMVGDWIGFDPIGVLQGVLDRPRQQAAH